MLTDVFVEFAEVRHKLDAAIFLWDDECWGSSIAAARYFDDLYFAESFKLFLECLGVRNWNWISLQMKWDGAWGELYMHDSVRVRFQPVGEEVGECGEHVAEAALLRWGKVFNLLH